MRLPPLQRSLFIHTIHTQTHTNISISKTKTVSYINIELLQHFENGFWIAQLLSRLLNAHQVACFIAHEHYHLSCHSRSFSVHTFGLTVRQHYPLTLGKFLVAVHPQHHREDRKKGELIKTPRTVEENEKKI